jgi:hypothetical protein
MFTAINPAKTRGLKPAAAELWHLWTVIFPRRSITGRLVRGRVWRRHDGAVSNTRNSSSTIRMENDA